MAKARDEIQFSPKALPNVNVRAVDTFYSPATPYVDPSISELASSLSSIVPSLAKYSVIKDKETQEIATGEAAVAFRKNNMLGFKQAVKEGKIPEGANPYFVEAYVQQELIQKANQFKDELYKEWKDKGIVNNTDPQAFDNFFAEKSREFRDTHKLDGYDSADIATAFIPNVEAARAGLFERHINTRMEVIADKNYKLLANNSVKAIENAYSASGDFDVEALGVELSKVGEDLVAKGMNGSKVNDILVDTITQQAEDLEDEEILKLLTQIKTATGTLADTAYAKEKIDDAENNILVKQRNEINWLQGQKDRLDRELEEGEVSKVLEKINTDGIENLNLEQYLKDNEIVNPTVTASLYSLTNTIANAKATVVEDTGYVAEILLTMNTNVDDPLLMNKIINGMGEKYTVGRGIQLFNNYLTRRQQGRHIFLKDSGYQEKRSSIRAAIKKDGLFAADVLRAEVAVMELDDYAFDWIQKNPKATQSEFNTAMRKEWLEISNVYLSDKQFKKITKFETDIQEKDNPKPVIEESNTNEDVSGVFSGDQEKFNEANEQELLKQKRESLVNEFIGIRIELAEVQNDIDAIEKSPSKNKDAKKILLAPLNHKKVQLTKEFEDVSKQIEAIE